jgi:hypothetical protein
MQEDEETRKPGYEVVGPCKAPRERRRPGTEEKRWVDGVLGRKKGLGF